MNRELDIDDGGSAAVLRGLGRVPMVGSKERSVSVFEVGR